MKFDIITFGGAVVDAFVYTNVHEVHKKMCYNVGEKIAINKLQFSTGGGGTNTSVSFSKLGLKTGTIIKIGKDENSQLILNELKKEKVSFLGKQEQGLTDFSVILDSKEHDRTVLTYKEKSNNISLSDVPLKKLKTKWFYFSATDNTSLDTQKALALYASKNKIYNPSSYLTKKGVGYIKKILDHVDVLILNNDEAKDLIPEGDLFQGLHSLGPKIVCITYGGEGNKVSDGSRILTSLPRKIKVAERTGAGDAFASAFVTGIIKTNNPEVAIKLGSLNAESVIQIPGAKNGLLTWKEISKQLKENLIKVRQN
ncbi:carbohydrate kinase family protein [Candidatus Pacearchaeota archaeon]|nr:carbohydrate kinase family protein [Candidatus Pacearchaeota archaeon]